MNAAGERAPAGGIAEEEADVRRECLRFARGRERREDGPRALGENAREAERGRAAAQTRDADGRPGRLVQRAHETRDDVRECGLHGELRPIPAAARGGKRGIWQGAEKRPAARPARGAVAKRQEIAIARVPRLPRWLRQPRHDGRA